MNHMNKTPEFWGQVLSYLSQYKDQGVFAALAGLVAILRVMYNGGGWKKTLPDAVLCVFLGWFAKDLLALMGMNPGLAYITSVMIKGKAGVNQHTANATTIRGISTTTR